MWRLALPALSLLLAAACSSGTVYRVHPMYPIGPLGIRPPLREVAVLLVASPDEGEGVCEILKVRDVAEGREYVPATGDNLIELEPGSYQLQVRYRVADAQLGETTTGEKSLRLRNLRSQLPVPMTFQAEAGGTYFVAGELRRLAFVKPDERARYHPVVLTTTVSRIEGRPAEETQPVDTLVWRPEIRRLSDASAERYRRYR